MKKMIIIILISAITTNSFAFQDLESTPPTPFFNSPQEAFLDATTTVSVPACDLAMDADENMPNVQEYDQYVTDTATVPKISNFEIAIQKMIGLVIVHYISLKEVASAHISLIKNTILNWYHRIIT